MKLDQAQHIVEEAKQDGRLDVKLDARKTSTAHVGGYRVSLFLRKFQTRMVAKQPEDWQLIKDLWAGL
jgi:hypothetical protein